MPCAGSTGKFVWIKLKRKLPLLVEIPDRHGTGRKKDFITSYVNEAIGLKL